MWFYVLNVMVFYARNDNSKISRNCGVFNIIMRGSECHSCFEWPGAPVGGGWRLGVWCSPSLTSVVVSPPGPQSRQHLWMSQSQETEQLPRIHQDKDRGEQEAGGEGEAPLHLEELTQYVIGRGRFCEWSELMAERTRPSLGRTLMCGDHWDIPAATPHVQTPHIRSDIILCLQ